MKEMLHTTEISKNDVLNHSIPSLVSSDQIQVTRYKRPATSDQRPATSNQRPETSNPRLLRLALVLLMLLIPGFGAIAAIQDEDATEFREVIQKLSSFADRSTGTAGNKAAADYIKTKFSQLGFEVVGSHQFATAVMQYGKSTISIPDRGITLSIRPLHSNAISPQKIGAPGISAPLIYAGSGELNEINGKTIENAVLFV